MAQTVRNQEALDRHARVEEADVWRKNEYWREEERTRVERNIIGCSIVALKANWRNRRTAIKDVRP